MKKQATAALLALFSLLSASCGGGTADPVTTTGGNDSATTPETTANLYSDLPTGDYGGSDFNIFNTTMGWAYSALDAEEQTGSALDDAVYNRTRKVEEKLKIKVNVTEMDVFSGIPEYVKNIIMAGDDSFDAYYMSAYLTGPMIVENLFVDLYSVDELNFDKPWWDTRTREYYEVNGKLYMAHGSGQINYFDMLWGIYFNKQMVEDLSLESPYDLVNSGKWTMEAMKKLGMAVSSDMNGDGEMTEDDRFGLITINGGSSLAFLHGCDERGIDTDNGKLALSKIDDRMFGVMTIIKQNIYENKDEVLIKDDKTLFTSGHSLFYAEVLGNAKVLRSMDTDFGIIPFPKYDEAQEKYVSYTSYGAIALSLPTSLSAEKLSRSATVMENFNALSYETVLPAYYTITLYGKTLRDEESADMLDIMFANCECEDAAVFGFDGYQNTITDVLCQGKEITSTLEAKRASVEEKIDELYEAMD